MSTHDNILYKDDHMLKHLEGKVLFDSVNNTIYIVKGNQVDPYVLNYKKYLEKLNKIKNEKVIELQEYYELRKQIAASNANHETVTQQDAAKLFEEVAREGASDIHIRKHENFADVFIRVDGHLRHHAQWHGDYAYQLCRTIYGAIADIAETNFNPHQPQAARIANAEMLPESLYGIRIASLPKVGGFFMALRLLYDDTGVEQGGMTQRLKNLGYSKVQTDVIRYMRERPSGINILAGPTGSGKSTTQKHVLEALAIEHPELNIMTVEDPPEYPMLGVVQVPVMAAGGSSDQGNQEKRQEAFGDTIRAVLRSDPDIIMIGEIRDAESAHLALQAAMTGHQVWTTLHANSSFAIISRMVDLLGGQINNPLNVIADNSSLTGLMFQRLITRLCPYCSVPLNEVDADMRGTEFKRVLYRLSQLANFESNDVTIRFKSLEGCEHCNYKGEKGRTVLAETVAPDPEMLRLIRENPTLSPAQHYWLNTQQGKTIIRHALEKIEKGEIDASSAENALGPLNYDDIVKDDKLEQNEITDLNREASQNDILENVGYDQ
jgi:type II secretory ATPase GspE/PulE/Tfp pilus assembly ATPase PilB-like protein